MTRPRLLVPKTLDDDAIARYAAEVLPERDADGEIVYPEWRRKWIQSGIKAHDDAEFTEMHIRFPRSRVTQLSSMARAQDLSRDSLIRRLIAEFMIANTDEPRETVEYDFPLSGWKRKAYGKNGKRILVDRGRDGGR